MKRRSTRAGLVAVLAGVASALSGTACGNTASNPDPQPNADRNRGGGIAGSAGQPHASGTGGPVSGTGGPVSGTGGTVSGTGGRASAGTGQTASAGSESPVVGGGGVPARNPLIVGDDACPAEAPRRLDGCPKPGASCVYRGIVALVFSSDQPFRCACDGDTWACAQSGENGEEICPFVTELPGPNVACPTSGGPCEYWLPGRMGLAYCSCREDDTAGGAAGAGGAGPSSIWSCGF